MFAAFLGAKTAEALLLAGLGTAAAAGSAAALASASRRSPSPGPFRRRNVVIRIIKKKNGDDDSDTESDNNSDSHSDSDDEEGYLYHYTSLDMAMEIIDSGYIRSSTPEARDAYSGAGVYLTEIPPSRGRAEIFYNNYDGQRRTVNWKLKGPFGRRVQVYFRFRKSELRGVQNESGNGRDVWLCPGNIDLHRVHWLLGETDGGVLKRRCPKKGYKRCRKNP